MHTLKKNNMLYTFYYFIFLAVITFLITYQTLTLPGQLPITATASQIYGHWHGGDIGAFVLGGLNFYSSTGFDGKAQGILPIWPPGFMILEGTILKLLGISAPLILALQTLAIFCLAIALNLFRQVLQVFTKNTYVALIPLILLAFPLFRFFMLDRTAILLGETFAISFVFIGLFSLLLSQAHNKYLFAILAGVMFAASAYFRPEYETYFIVATLNLLLIFGLFLAYKKYLASPKNPELSKIMRAFFMVFISVVSFHLCTIPYRIYNHSQWKTYSWTQDLKITWLHNIIPTQLLNSTGHGFEATGLGNMVCVINSDLCSRIDQKTITTREAKRIVLETFFKHPFKWVDIKFSALPDYWFSFAHNYNTLATINKPFDYIQNTIFLICFIFSGFWLFANLKNPYSLIMLWLSSSILIAYFVIFIFTHYETRYFFFLKFYCLVVAILSLVQLINKYSESNISTLETRLANT